MGRTGTAGNHGGRIRSDCLVQIGIKRTGGIELGLESKVETLYGNAIRELVRAVTGHFEIKHANILIRDSGALDFVIAARLEAAIRQVLPEGGEYLLPGSSPGLPAPERERFRLTRLYLPGNTPGMMLNAGIHKPDGIILDLEDSVHPDAKDEARILVRNALRSLDFLGAERMVRINPLPLGTRDLEAVLPQQPDLILIPKTESPDTVREVEKKILEVSPQRAVFLMPILESALGIEKCFEIATAAESVVAMAIGLEDYTADIGVERTEEGTESFYARTRMVNACRAAGIQAIDSVYSDVENEEGLRETVSRSRGLGFDGMGCIHPRQIRVIRDAYRPSARELEKAAAIVTAYEQAAKTGSGVVSLGSKMIDAPVVRRARRTIELADRMGPAPE
jgi:citrate lyase subunit beta/citryl-CoA lyase